MAGLLLVAAQLAIAQPLWLDDAGRPGAAAREALGWLMQAESEGLRPADYQAAALAQALAAPPASPEAAARLDAAISAAVLRYLAELRHGRVAPAQIGARYDSASAPPADLPALLRDSLARGQPAEVLRAATPPWPQYPVLREALAQYRALADHPAWRQPLPALPGGKLAAGARWDGLPALAARLQSLGDLAAGDAIAPAALDSTLQQGLKSFQRRHGLPADGVLGKSTLEALSVPPASRARQLELALERLRLTPLPAAPHFIAVNVPSFMLSAFAQAEGDARVAFEMRVIVGKALDTRTPLFDEDMRWIEFSPYWNIPNSIARGETVPKLRASPGYLAAQGMEFVGPGGQISTAVTPEALDAAATGQWRIRQRPGPKNALGDIKFMLPNNQNIYLHHTPSVGLFERARRDFSHGCIRIEEPVALAQWVLQGDPQWSAERIRAAMGRPRPVVAPLPAPVPVLITYSTVAVHGERVHFAPDLYRQDPLLEQALRRRAGASVAAAAPPNQPPATVTLFSGAPVSIAAK